MDQERIEHLAKRLGEGAEERIDAAVTARAVLERLEREPATRSVWRGRRVLHAAAALVMLVAGGLVVRALSVDGRVDDVALPAPVELRDLAAADLADVLDSLEVYRSVAELVPASLDDLDESELRQLLQWMEG